METPFAIEYHCDTPEFTDQLKERIERRVDKLVHGKRDVTGASIAVQKGSNGSAAPDYQARIVLYCRPENVAAVRHSGTATQALMDALDAVERQVREHRARLRARRRQNSD